jgi:predicted dehydrogenase
MKTGLIGYGYWGKIIDSKLKNNSITPPFNDVDWVFVATPPKTHYDIVKEYIIKNKNVFCEKPLTLSYESSKELIKLADENNVCLYVDNLFILRNEIKELKIESCNNIEFTWLKEGPFKDTLVNDLLYHDLYILVHLLGNNTITNINYTENTINKLIVNFNYGNINVKINYNREWNDKKTKLIKIDDNIIDLSNPNNDPLQESIDKCLSNNMDFKYNHYLSLKTIELLELFL